MTDRELLELAAKAGYAKTVAQLHCPISGTWNPLTDDGDALRLAVKLRLLGLESIRQGGQWRIDLFANGMDECAATRRAITRAAAEIGRSQ